LTLQQELFPDTVLTLAYTGAVGQHAIRTAEANTALPTGTVNGLNVWCTDPGAGCVSNIEPDFDRRNDNFGFVLMLNTDANSSYHSFQTSLRKRYSQGLQFLTSYTWGHSLDDGSQQWGSEGRNNPQNTFDQYDHTFDRGSSIYDVRHAFSFSGIYELPFGQGKQFGSNMSGVTNQILGGWEINSILVLTAGNPFTMQTSFNRSDNHDDRQPDRPNIRSGFSLNPTEGVSAGCLNPDGSVAVAPGTQLGHPDLWYDKCALELNNWGTIGNIGRTTARGDGVVQVDFVLSKRFVLTEDVGMQFRAEFFNVPNTPNFAHPNLALFEEDGTYKKPSGKITRTVTTSRQIQFALRIEF